MSVSLLLLWSILIESTIGIYYVLPNPADPCHGQTCETLDFYASNASEYFTDNTSFIFLPGTHVLSNISIHNVSNVVLMASAELDEGNVTLQCNGSGGLVFQHVSNVVLANLSFVSCGQPLPLSLQREGETAQAALAFGEVTDLLLESLSVSHSRGFGVLGHCVCGDFTITKSNFTSNKGSVHYLGGNGAIEYTNCSSVAATSRVRITSSAFRYGDYDGYDHTRHAYTATYATGLLLIIAHSNISATIADVNMEHNVNNYFNKFGGNLFIRVYSYITANNVTIIESRFMNGTARLGAGVGLSFLSSKYSLHDGKCAPFHFMLLKTQLSHNTGIAGSGLYYEFQMDKPSSNCSYANVTVKNSTFQGNTMKIETINSSHFIDTGVAVHLLAKCTYRVIEKIHDHYETNFIDCIFHNSQLMTLLKFRTTNTKLASGVMTIRNENMDSSLTNCEIADNAFPGIGLSNSKVKVSGELLLRNNTGINGGGMLFCASSYLILTRNTTISFINNHAVQLGGGIYIESGCLHAQRFCFYQPDYSRDTWDCANISDSVSIVMINNTAGYAGDHIYGGTLDNCKVSDCNSVEIFNTLFVTTPHASKSHLSAVTSMPRRICFCDDQQIPDCTILTKELFEAKYPGEFVTFDIVAVGQLNGTVPGTVLYRTEYSDLKPEVYSTLINCTTLKVQVRTNETKEMKINLELTSNLYHSTEHITFLSVSDPLTILVPLKKKTCPLGFSHDGGGICDCIRELKHHHLQCDISTYTITRTPPAWIGYYNTSDGTEVIYHKVCPYDYCLTEIVNITSEGTIFDQDSQCAPKRTGLLCSKCEGGKTLSIGTSDCIECDSRLALPLLIIAYPLCAALLVVLLIVFDTYTDGTFSGALFYANVINLHDFIFLPRHQVNTPVRVLLSWMSLNIGIVTCFYAGMDSYGKSWLNFCFPVYLFLITAVIIVLVRNSSKLAQLFGGNIVKVVATIFILSYTKLIQSVVTVLSATVIHYPSSNTTDEGFYKIVLVA